jgi:hypothetical protein
MPSKFPAEKSRPFLYKAGIRLMNQTIIDGFVPEETALSFPVPLYGKQRVNYFQYLPLLDSDNQLESVRLLTYIEVELLPDSPDLIEFISVEHVEQAQVFADLPHQISLAEFHGVQDTTRRQLENALFVSVARLLEIDHQDIPVDEARQTYLNVLRALSYPEMLPYYRALNTQFMENIGL